MEQKVNWTRVMYIIGVIATIGGILDPMEGSIAIAAGILVTTVSSFLLHDRHRAIFLLSAILIFIGVSSLWFVSSLGGFDPRAEWWWWILIAPYPLGWLLSVILLLYRAVKNSQEQISV